MYGLLWFIIKCLCDFWYCVVVVSRFFKKVMWRKRSSVQEQKGWKLLVKYFRYFILARLHSIYYRLYVVFTKYLIFCLQCYGSIEGEISRQQWKWNCTKEGYPQIERKWIKYYRNILCCICVTGIWLIFKMLISYLSFFKMAPEARLV